MGRKGNPLVAIVRFWFLVDLAYWDTWVICTNIVLQV